MPKLQNDRLLKALRCEPVDYTPIWLMRQAGRYLPEYRRVREQAGSFMQLCKTPELACEVTLQPIDRFGFDAAILFSDILTIPDALGLGLQFVEGEGPIFSNPIKTVSDIEQLPTLGVIEQLNYVYDAVRTIKQGLSDRVPLIGFAGSPWTLACYMVEGGTSKTFSKIKKLRYDHPQAMQQLLTQLSQLVTAYLTEQINAGVDVVMLFDSWGGILSEADYYDYSLNHMQAIIHALKQQDRTRKIPTIIFSKGCSSCIEAIAESGCEAIGLDWTIDIAKARHKIDNTIALQGNLDPSVLLSHPDCVQAEAIKLLKRFGPNPGHIFNLGHGITPDVPPENVSALVEAVQNFRHASP